MLRSRPLLSLWCALLCFALPLHAQKGAPASDASADLKHGEEALKANDQATAAQYFEKVVKTDPANVEANADLGLMAFFHGDCGKAEPHLRVALHGSPGLTKVGALLSVCEHRRGDPAAQANMESAFAKLDDANLKKQLGIELANSYYQQGDFEKTASILHTLLTMDPDNVDILFFAQRVYSELADNTLNKLAVLSPDSARMEQLIAERLINAGDLKSATVHYRKAIALGPKLPGLHFELAETLIESSPDKPETRKEAHAELEAALQVDGDSSKVECVLARLAMLQGETAEAYRRYQKAYELNPNDADAQMGLGDVLRMQDKLTDAATYLRMAVKTDPFNPEAHYKLSQLDRQLGLSDEQKKEMQLYLDIRATRDKVKSLYQQMNPQGPADARPATIATP